MPCTVLKCHKPPPPHKLYTQIFLLVNRYINKQTNRIQNILIIYLTEVSEVFSANRIT